MASPVPARGMRDFLPDEKRRREHVLAEIRAAYQAFGYQEIETPALENLDVLTSGQGGENEKMLFRVLRRGLPEDVPVRPSEAADLGLRFDLTVPLARFYATHRAELPRPFRAIQVAPVWRAERPQKGRFRQFTQCDIDVIGEAGVLAEVELITATLVALGRLGIDGVGLRVNDRRVLTGLLGECGFAPPDFAAALITVDKLDKVGVAGVRDELERRQVGDRASVAALTDLLDAYAAVGPHPGFDEVVKLLPAGVDRAAVDDLREIVDGVRGAVPGQEAVFDVTLVRGMGYYTGAIFELSHPSATGSVAGGGRYDRMIGRFLDETVPACGFSIGFERIVDLVAERAARTGMRLAVVYDGDVSPGELVVHQRRMLDDGAAEVRLVPAPRRLGPLRRALEEAGFTHLQLVGTEAGHLAARSPEPLGGPRQPDRS